ncbi:MAG: TAXI family TRAP transporter solute-binding subunit [Lachnospiraceae bacterium]|nr:TAXI family TRAP transporter solute-binding subunit [Lachnospiraceae bacterium]
MKKLLALLLAISLTVSLAACGTKDNTSKEEPKTSVEEKEEESKEEVPEESSGPAYPMPSSKATISTGSGNSGGTVFTYMSGAASLLNSTIDNFELVVESTAGSFANMTLLKNGDVDISQIEVGLAYDYYTGNGVDAAETFEDLRVISPMYVSQWFIVTLDSSITKLEDLNGKTIGAGSANSAADIYDRMFVEFFDIDCTIVNEGWGDCFEDMYDGSIDVVMGCTGQPSSPVVELETKTDVYLLQMTDEEIDKWLEAYPQFSPSVIENGAYKCVDADGYKSFGSWSMLCTTADFDESLGYWIAKTILDNNDYMLNVHSAAKDSICENITDQPMAIHKGALAYYKEAGIEIPDALIGSEAK